MRVKQGNLKVFYAGGADPALDKAIKKAVGKFGYRRWRSGYNILWGVRDLAFEREPTATEVEAGAAVTATTPEGDKG